METTNLNEQVQTEHEDIASMVADTITDPTSHDLDAILSQYDDFASFELGIENDDATTAQLVSEGTEAVDADDTPLLRLQVSAPYGSTEWQGHLGLEGELLLLDRQSLAFPEPLVRSEHYSETPTYQELAKERKTVTVTPSQIFFARSLYARDEKNRCRATARDEAKLAATDNSLLAGTACVNCRFNDENENYDPDGGKTCSKFRVIRGAMPQHGGLDIEHRVRINSNSYATNREFSEKLTRFREMFERWPLFSISTRRTSLRDNRARCIYFIHQTPAVEPVESAVSKFVLDPKHPVRKLHNLLSNEIERVLQSNAENDAEGQLKNEFYWSEFEDMVPKSELPQLEAALHLASRLDNWYYRIDHDELNNDWYITDRLG